MSLLPVLSLPLVSFVSLASALKFTAGPLLSRRVDGHSSRAAAETIAWQIL